MKPSADETLLQQLCFASDSPSSRPIVIIAAHPDDEVIGAGAQLSRWRSAQFIHVTDGAPRDMRDAITAGFVCRKDYAQTRRGELESALALAGLQSAPLRELGAVDQEASLNLVELVNRLADAFREIQPKAVITHPYEGGHPDHDATAFAVQAACRLLASQGIAAPAIIEMTSYFNRAGIMATGEFLPRAGRLAITIRLTELQREFKQRLLDCFATQRKVLAAFQLECERFRLAPRYDFTQPPHAGTLYYEMFDWGMTGERWRGLAAEALAELGLGTYHNEPDHSQRCLSAGARRT